MQEEKSSRSEIKLSIVLDEEKLPSKIYWQAPDGGVDEPAECGAFMLSIWDQEKQEAMRIDLWNSDMRKDQMNKFLFQTLITMADTYMRSNGDEVIADEIRDFAYNFGEKTKVIKRVQK